MDEAAFRAARVRVTEYACVFEKSLLARCADCRLAARHALAEREAIGCQSSVARANCGTLYAILRERSTFALKFSRPSAPLPDALTMRLQCGGLAGLASALTAGKLGNVHTNDVHALVTAARDRYGALTDLPWPEIVAAVVAWQGRKHRPR